MRSRVVVDEPGDSGKRQEQKAHSKPNDAANERTIKLPETVSATDLYEEEDTPVRALFEGLLWDGLTMLVARPKAGKSWLALQFALHIVGARLLDGVVPGDDCEGKVLYAALEEKKPRTKKRLRKLATKGDWTNNLEFIYHLLPLMGGGAEELSAKIEQMKPRLVVIDTFTAFVGNSTQKSSDVFRSQYAEVSRIREIADQFGIAIILIHHMRKGLSQGGVIEAIAGTGGMSAAIDCAWGLIRKPEGEATLEVVGRDTEGEKILAMKFEQEPCGWRFLGDDAVQLLNAERRDVIELLREEGGLTPAQIAAELAKSRPATRMLLKRMKDAGQVIKDGKQYIHTINCSK